jgi:hypothetical protein
VSRSDNQAMTREIERELKMSRKRGAIAWS